MKPLSETRQDQLRQALGSAAGLCRRCRHLRPLSNARGSVFVFCERSKTDPRFARYPPLPVLECAGFESEVGKLEDGEL